MKLKTSVRVMPFYAALYAALAVYQSFFTVYLSRIGMDPARIGVIMSISPMVALLGQPLFGSIGDRINYKNNLLFILSIGAIASMFFISKLHQYWQICVGMGFYCLFYLSIQPMGDSIALESLDKAGESFSPVRTVGSLTFAFVSILAGRFLENRIGVVPSAICVMLMITLLTAFILPKVRGHKKKGEKINVLALIKYKPLAVMLLLTVCMMIGMSFFYNYFSIYFQDELGGTSSMLGWAYFISATSELPFLLIADKLYTKYGVGRLLLISAGVMMIRWFLLSIIRSAYIAMALQLLHSFCFTVMSFFMMRYINAIAPDSLKAGGQLLYTLFTLGIARIIGSLLGGQIGSIFGLRAIFVSGGILMAFSLVVFGIYVHKNNAELLLGSRGEVKIT
ncbi:MAG: MFS transporter [Clostridiales bacterium]|nr:MFS transporter [Clostridiales bacterium]